MHWMTSGYEKVYIEQFIYKGLKIVLPLIIVLKIIVLSYFWYSYNYWKSRNVPYVKPWFPFGSFTPLGFFTKGFHRTMYEHYVFFKKRGARYFGTYAIATPMLTIIDPELIKLILVKDHDHFLSHGLQYDKKDVLTLTLFNIENEEWKRMRTKLSPTFSSGKLKSMFETLNDCTVSLVEHLRIMENQEIIKNDGFSERPSTKIDVNITELFGRFFTNVIASCIFGIECDCIKNPDEVFRKYGRQCFEERMDLRLRRIVAFTAPWMIKYLGFKVLKKDADAFFKNIFKEIFDHRERSGTRRNDFVQILLDLKDKTLAEGDVPLTHEEMLANSFLFFSAGFETSSSTLTYCLHELAYHEEVQEKLRWEIEEVVQKHGGSFSYDCLNELKYMDQVLYESLRRHPSAPTIPRKCTSDYQIPNGPKITKGTKVFVNILGLHWDEDYFPEPKRFDPNRFSDKNKASIKPYSFLPFGIGPRKCIAERFGMAQIKVALVAVLPKYLIRPNRRTAYDLEYHKNNIILVSANPIYVTMERIVN